MPSDADIVVIGGGAAGLAAALELQQQGLQTMRDVLVLDAERRPGGTWARAWDALPMRFAHGLAEPEGLADFGLSLRDGDPGAPVRDIVPRAFALYEDAVNLYVYRPARVVHVSAQRRSPRLRVEYVAPTGALRSVECRVLIDATGHWSSPFVPWVPGMRGYGGRHVAAARLERLADLAGCRVLVVGGGRTAATLLQVLEGRAADLAWSTRREPDVRDAVGAAGVGARGLGPAAPGARAGVRRSGVPPWSGVRELSAARREPQRAWIPRTPEVDAAIERGVLRSRGPLRRFGAGGGLDAWFDDGSRFDADVVVWATGSHTPLRHLAPLKLRWLRDGPRARRGWSRSDHRVAIVGDGPDATGAEALEHATVIAREAIDALDLR